LKDLSDLPLKGAVDRVEVFLLQRALAAAHFNQRRAAEALGLTYHQFRGFYRKHLEALRPPRD
jgi:psp operon transcriptional activator